MTRREVEFEPLHHVPPHKPKRTVAFNTFVVPVPFPFVTMFGNGWHIQKMAVA